MENINDILLSHILKVRDKIYVIICTPESISDNIYDMGLHRNTDNFDTMSNQLWGDVGNNVRTSLLKHIK
jgi:hypothetical protein